MKKEKLISLGLLAEYYTINMSFFHSLGEHGLIEIITEQGSYYVHNDKIQNIEKIIRLHKDLELNTESIEIVFNLLKKIENLQSDLNYTKNRLKIYE